ncbi:MAG: insulinase family protein [Candidatus Pacebacteria bacterium]|nr:insulinase family protein [Candidatus Paceibacterota bacterium]
MYNFELFGIEYQTRKLKNGAEIRLLKKVGAPIHIQACIRAGSRYNTISGLAHFFEHMLVAGTLSYPSKLSLATALEKVGGNFEATTDADFVRLTISVPQKSNASLALFILNEMLTRSLYSEDVFLNEKSVVLREQEERLRNTPLLLMDSLMEKMYPDYETNFKNLGTAKSLSDLQISDIRKFSITNVTADSTVYIVSGDVEMSDIEEQLSTIDLPTGRNMPVSEAPAISNSEHALHIERKGDNSDLLIGFRCDTNTHEDIAGLILIQQMFMGKSSSFMQRLRYERGLVYSGGVPFWDFNKTSIFGFRTICATKNASEVAHIMMDILINIYSNGITKSECESAKVKANSHYHFDLQTSMQWVDAESTSIRHNYDSDISGNALTIPTCTQQIDQVTLTDIFRKYFSSDNAYSVVFGQATSNNS